MDLINCHIWFHLRSYLFLEKQMVMSSLCVYHSQDRLLGYLALRPCRISSQSLQYGGMTTWTFMWQLGTTNVHVMEKESARKKLYQLLDLALEVM